MENENAVERRMINRQPRTHVVHNRMRELAKQFPMNTELRRYLKLF